MLFWTRVRDLQLLVVYPYLKICLSYTDIVIFILKTDQKSATVGVSKLGKYGHIES